MTDWLSSTRPRDLTFFSFLQHGMAFVADFLVPSIRSMPLSLYTQYKCIKSFTNSFSKNFFSSVINIASIKKVLPPFFSVWLEFYPVAFKKLTFFLASAFMSDCLISVRSSRLKKKKYSLSLFQRGVLPLSILASRLARRNFTFLMRWIRKPKNRKLGDSAV
jgi:hypothetical protein